ncbi:MAG: ABC transporter ATP-binding protein [Anaerolineae bacterium]|nr:ABC transporter ATP-binding protein [Anaerolineae bacterium]
MTPTIQVRHLRKVFGDKVAVADLSLTVERGEVFGFLGPNGAGKTTSIKMLLALIESTSGEAQILGLPPGDPRARRKVGFLPEHFRFHDWLKAGEFLQLHADLYKMPRDVSQKRIPELLKLVGLQDHAGKKLRTYSKGMLQRVGLAQALLNEPELVFLDEPTSGLDPLGRRLVRDIMGDLRERGATIFLNSHLLSEVEITCDRVAFISHGEVIQTRTLRGAAAIKGELSVQIRARPHSSLQENGRWEAVVGGLAQWGQNVRVEGGTSGDVQQISLTLPGEADLPQVTRYLVENEIDVYAVSPQKLSLEDLFMQLVGTEESL